ncbi:MAG: hypothetical protein ACREJ3_13760, partial [Polyangiaceae bacterium]
MPRHPLWIHAAQSRRSPKTAGEKARGGFVYPDPHSTYDKWHIEDRLLWLVSTRSIERATSASWLT